MKVMVPLWDQRRRRENKKKCFSTGNCPRHSIEESGYDLPLGMKYLLWPIRSDCFDFDALLNQQDPESKIVIKVMAKLVMDAAQSDPMWWLFYSQILALFGNQWFYFLAIVNIF